MNEWKALWGLDPSITFLNHGSFGACPKAVLDSQTALRNELEREPVLFFLTRHERLLDEARSTLATLVGASPEDLVFVANASTGVSTVLRSLPLMPGQELLTTNHAYNACRNAVDYVAERSGAAVVVVDIPCPVRDEDDVVGAILARANARTRLAMIDHVTSPTGMVFPIATIVTELRRRGIETLVDGAHAPGMVPLHIDSLGAAYYTGNCHKWLCSPKSAGFLHVRRDLRDEIRPLTISHGKNTPRPGRSRFQTEFDWTGTVDPTPAHCVRSSIEFLGAKMPGGWPEIREVNRALALAGRKLLAERTGFVPLAPENMIGTLASFFLPDGLSWDAQPGLHALPLQVALMEKFRIEIPVSVWPGKRSHVIRISAHLYNTIEEYERLADALGALTLEKRPAHA